MAKKIVLLCIVLFACCMISVVFAEKHKADLLIETLSEATDSELENARQLILSEQHARIKPYIALNQSELRVAKGKTIELKATVNDLVDNNSIGKFEWYSSDESIVTITKNGRLRAVSAGSADIKCFVSVSDGTELSAICSVTVFVPVAAIKLDPKSLQIIRGRELAVIPFVTPQDASDKRVSYSSSDETIATVSDSGVITALEAGVFTLTITALDGSGTSATVKGTVLQDVEKIVFETENVSIPVGKNNLLKPTILPAKSADKTLLWSSADESIAKVDEKGNITAVSTGTTVISVEASGGNGVTASCQVTVVDPVQSIVLSESALEAIVSLEYQVTAEVFPNTATNRELIWSSTNENVATVDQSGKIIPIAKGNCIIAVEATDGSGVKAQTKVKVQQYDVVITEPNQSVTVTYDRIDLNAGMFMTDWNSKNNCVEISGGNGSLVLTPVKAGTDKVTLKEREYFSRKQVSASWTIYVAPSAVTN